MISIGVAVQQRDETRSVSMKTIQEIPVLLLLLGFIAILAVPSEATFKAPDEEKGEQTFYRRGEARWPSILPRRGRKPWFGILPPPIITDPEVRACWARLRQTPDCVYSIYHSHFSGTISLSRKCCKATEKFPEHCSSKILSSFPFEASFPRRIKAFCAAHKGIPPSL